MNNTTVFTHKTLTTAIRGLATRMDSMFTADAVAASKKFKGEAFGADGKVTSDLNAFIKSHQASLMTQALKADREAEGFEPTSPREVWVAGGNSDGLYKVYAGRASSAIAAILKNGYGSAKGLSLAKLNTEGRDLGAEPSRKGKKAGKASPKVKVDFAALTKLRADVEPVAQRLAKANRKLSKAESELLAIAKRVIDAIPAQ